MIVIAYVAIIGVFAYIVMRQLKPSRNEQFRIPNVIWTYWHDHDHIPQMVQQCIASWKKTNPGYQVVILDMDMVEQLCGVDLRSISAVANSEPARIADYCRLLVVAKYGGFWIDASILCLESLEWIHKLRKSNDAEMVGFYAPVTTNMDYPIPESWFFAAPPKSPFVEAWKNEAISFAMTYSDDLAYVQDVKNQGKTDLQNLEQSLPYLMIHLWATVVMQRRAKDHRYKVYLMSATEDGGPFMYLSATHWKHPDAILALCNDRNLQTKLIKFRGTDREYIEKHGGDIKCNNDESHPFVHQLVNGIEQENKRISDDITLLL